MFSESFAPQILAALTAIFTITAITMLLRGLLKKTSQPYLWSWVIRGGLCAVALLSQVAGGARYSLMLSGTQLLGCFFIVGLLFYRKPRAGRLSRIDWLAIAISGAGVAWWQLSGDPLYGLLGVLTADGVATALGIRACLLRRASESMPFWVLSFAASCTAVLSADSASLVVLLAPLFSCCNALANIAAIAYVRARKRRTIHEQTIAIEADPA
ncbi:MAG TPA: hypothetical protein VLI54_00590 [Bacillota bacterium]|nr:hypothetical protein [Bacillota bacterium]